MGVEIDKSQLLALAGSDKDVFLSIVEDFREDGIKLVRSIERALSDGDGGGAKESIHQLKGSSGSLGMKSLYEACVDMEQMSAEDISSECVDELRRQHEESVQSALSCLRG